MYGEALVSTEHLTGEALPVRKGRDDEILAGALNHDGLLVVRSSSASSDSTPARIAKLTEAARVSQYLASYLYFLLPRLPPNEQMKTFLCISVTITPILPHPVQLALLAPRWR